MLVTLASILGFCAAALVWLTPQQKITVAVKHKIEEII